MFHVIDDDEIVRDMLVELLEAESHQAISFSSPTEYVKFAGSSEYQKPIGVFTDVHMPEMSGYALINAVSNIITDIKFVVMTGEPQTRSKYPERACMYLSKPFKPETLCKVVENLIRCDLQSPDNGRKCSDIDDRAQFPLENWNCPINY